MIHVPSETRFWDTYSDIPQSYTLLGSSSLSLFFILKMRLSTKWASFLISFWNQTELQTENEILSHIFHNDSLKNCDQVPNLSPSLESIYVGFGLFLRKLPVPGSFRIFLQLYKESVGYEPAVDQDRWKKWLTALHCMFCYFHLNITYVSIFHK